MADGPAEFLTTYPVRTPIVVQWGDQDAFAHVNNTVFLRWFEVGRIAYFERTGMMHDATGLGLGPILAAVACNFRRQVTFPDRVVVGTRVSRVGNSSLSVDHVVVSEARAAVVADGTSTVVYFRYDEGRSCPVPDDIRSAIRAIEAGGPGA